MGLVGRSAHILLGDDLSSDLSIQVGMLITTCYFRPGDLTPSFLVYHLDTHGRHSLEHTNIHIKLEIYLFSKVLVSH